MRSRKSISGNIHTLIGTESKSGTHMNRPCINRGLIKYHCSADFFFYMYVCRVKIKTTYEKEALAKVISDQ